MTNMSGVDDELERAVAESEAQDAAPLSDPPVVKEPAASPAQSRRNLGLLAALLVIGGGIVTLVMTSFDDAAIYSKGVDELLAEKDRMASRNVRVEGTLVKGTLKRRDEPCEYRFRITKNGQALDVRYAQCVVPDTFRDVPGMDVAVTAEGKLTEEGHFQASHIMAKCPSKYEMKEREAKGEKAPHAAIPKTAPASAN